MLRLFLPIPTASSGVRSLRRARPFRDASSQCISFYKPILLYNPVRFGPCSGP